MIISVIIINDIFPLYIYMLPVAYCLHLLPWASDVWSQLLLGESQVYPACMMGTRTALGRRCRRRAAWGAGPKI